VAPRCDDADPCTVERCDPAAGCVTAPAADGTACADGDRCNGDETCQAGACAPGAVPTCADGDPCTLDECVPASGCRNPEVTGLRAATCGLEGGLREALCADQVLPKALERAYERAGALALEAEGTTDARAQRRLLRRAARKLRQAKGAITRAAQRSGQKLTRDCATALKGRLDATAGRIQGAVRPLR
jgi:hypothetical protein